MAKLPPPTSPALFLLIGVVVHLFAWRLEPLPTVWNLVIGAMFVLIAISIATLAYRAFSSHGESLAVNIATNNLVTNSVYGYSRNPVYISFLLLIIGIGCAVNSTAILGSAVPSFIVLNWYTIPREERYLHSKLGVDYEQYRHTVRRWV